LWFHLHKIWLVFYVGLPDLTQPSSFTGLGTGYVFIFLFTFSLPFC
jgi:hypothetical protein